MLLLGYIADKPSFSFNKSLRHAMMLLRGSFYPIANEVAKGYTCSNATFRSSVCSPVTVVKGNPLQQLQQHQLWQ
jgi:hypothetical protein